MAHFMEKGSMSSITPDGVEDGGSTTRICTVRLDDFVYRDGNPAPSFAKIDIEGHAGPCLNGMRKILGEYRPPLVLELHNRGETEEVSRVLRECGYDARTLDRSHGFPRRIIARAQWR